MSDQGRPSSTPLNHISLDILAKTHIAKQLVYRGVATIITHAAHAAAPEYFWNVCDQHFTFQPFIHYLRPQQLLIEAARLGWDYLLLKVLSPGRLDSGAHTSPAHLAIFSDSFSQIVFPKALRPLMMYIPMTNAELLAATMNMTQAESRTIAIMQSLRWWGQSFIAAVERKLNNRTPRTWKTLFFCSAVDGLFQLGSYTFCNWVFYKFPQSWRSTSVRHISLSMTTICIGFALNAGIVNILNVTAFLPVFRKLQGYVEPQLPPVGPLSQYHEFNAMSMPEFRLMLEHINYMAVQESTSHRDRVALLMKMERMMVYDQAIRDPKTCRVLGRDPSELEEKNIPDEEYQKLRQRHDERMNKMFRTWGSVSSRAVLPSDVLYSPWQEVAHVAISRKLISRYTASFIEWDQEYRAVNTYSEWLLWVAVTLLDVSPTRENPCCQIPFL